MAGTFRTDIWHRVDSFAGIVANSEASRALVDEKVSAASGEFEARGVLGLGT